MTLPYRAFDGITEDELRRVITHAAHQHPPSPVPLQEILREGRVRRARRRIALSSAGAALAAGLAVPITTHVAGSPSTTNHGTATSHSMEAATLSELIGSGTVDGKAWSVTLEFHPKSPKGYELPAKVGISTQKGAVQSLLCPRVVIGGVRVDRKGGLWSGCHTVTGTRDSRQWSGAGLHDLRDPSSTGIRIFVGRICLGDPKQNVTDAEITLNDGKRLRARVNTVSRTGYGAFAIPLGKGQTIASVDQYNADHKRLTHETFWR